MKLGKTIREVRFKKGITQKELSIKANISQAYLSLIEKNKKKPSMEVLDKICNVFEVPTSILMLISTDTEDIPESKKKAFDQIFPSIESMMKNIFIGK